MTTDKSQPTGWVVVDFEDDNRMIRDRDEWRTSKSYVRPFSTEQDARWAWEETFVRGTSEVHPWPLPASVLARLKERHPTVDWSQVPVAVEKPGRWVLEDGCSIEPYRDRDGWKQSANVCSSPWSTRAEVEEFMKSKGWNPSSIRPVNLDDLPAPAVAEPSEVEKLRKENAYWMEECYHQQAKAERLQSEVERLKADRSIRDSEADGKRIADLVRVQAEKDAEVDRLTRERDELREELSRCKQAHSAAEDDVESLREQVSKLALSRALSRRDEFAKAALMGMLAGSSERERSADYAKTCCASYAVEYADLIIRALDGAGGA